MINNRQSGRRRGRGGQRSQGGQGRVEGGNRIDNRARGNAPQLLEKYKSLARDAQMGGDRVMTEYYLQFADHYFRVVSENRARFEDNRRPRDDEYDDDEGETLNAEDGGDDDRGQDWRQPRRDERPEPRPERQDREPRADRPDREARPRRDTMNGEAREPRDDGDQPRREFERRPRRAFTPREPVAEANGHAADEPTGFDPELLPPSFTATATTGDDEPSPTPRRRGRPRKPTEDGAIVE